MMYNGDVMFVARMILNTTSVTAHDEGQLLAVLKCELVYQYFLADRSGSYYLNILITWLSTNKLEKGVFNPPTLNVVNMDFSTSYSHSVDKYLKAKDNSYIHWNGSQLHRLDSSFKIKTIESAENIPNFTHIHSRANLIDHSEQVDFDTLTSIIENSALNILRILSLTSNNGDGLKIYL